MKAFIDFCHNDTREKIKNALHFVLHNKWIDKVIVGIEKQKQLLPDTKQKYGIIEMLNI